MTYPQQQPQYPGQPYAPAQGFQGQPGFYGAPQQQYAPQPAAPAQQQYANGGAAMATPTPALATGGGGGGSSTPSPRMRHLGGCTIIIVPKRVDENAMNNFVTPPQPRPDAYFDLIVVDSPAGKIQYGDSLDKMQPKPLAWEIATPCVFRDVKDYGWAPVNEVRNGLAQGQPARVGVVEAGKTAFLITQPDKVVDGGENSRPDGAERFQRATAVWAQVHSGQFVNPEPRPLLAAPTGPVPQVAYGQPAQPPAPAGYPYGGAAQPLAQQSPYTPHQQGYPRGFGQYGAPQPEMAPAAMQGYGQYAPPAQTFQPPAQPAAPQGTGNPAFDAYLSSLPEQQRAAALQQYSAQQGGGAAPPLGGPGI